MLVSPFLLVQRVRGVRLVVLVTVAVVVDVAGALRAFQCDRIRRLRAAFLLRLISWGGRFRGFAGVADV